MKLTEKITNYEEIDRWITGTLLLLGFQAGVTLFVVCIGFFTDLGSASEPLGFLADPGNLLDVALIVLFGVGLYFKSRTAAVGLLVYFFLSKAVVALEGMGGFGCMSLLFILVYGRAAEACWAYHRFEKQRDPDYKPSKVPAVVAGVLGFVVLPLLALGLVVIVMGVPDGVVTGEEVGIENVRELESESILLEGERLETAYFGELFELTDHGNLITDKSVISFERDASGALVVERVPRDQITYVGWTPEEEGFSATVEVQAAGHEPLYMWFLFDDEAREFREALRPD